jgi:hypothetical protein
MNGATSRPERHPPGIAQTGGRALLRIGRAWRRLDGEQRLAAAAALGLFLTMFLPWYQETGSALVNKRLVSVSDNLNAFQVFTFIEASVLLVATGVLALLFFRAEQRAFHLPGGDGAVITAGGAWVCLLVFIRQLDKPSGHGSAQFATTVGVQWGIFVAFVAGLALTYAGWRVRAAHRPEPPLPEEREPTVAAPTIPVAPRPPAAPTPAPPRPPARRRPAGPDEPIDGQLSLDDSPTEGR